MHRPLRNGFEFLSLLAFAALPLVGCSGDEDAGSEASPGCAVEIEITGDDEVSLPWDDEACAFTSSDSGVYVLYLTGEEVSITLEIEDVERDDLGEFPGSLQIDFADSGSYVADACVFTVESQTLDDESDNESDSFVTYLVTGTGSCPGGATDPETGDSIAFSDFRFAARTMWRLPRSE